MLFIDDDIFYVYIDWFCAYDIHWLPNDTIAYSPRMLRHANMTWTNNLDNLSTIVMDVQSDKWLYYGSYLWKQNMSYFMIHMVPWNIMLNNSTCTNGGRMALLIMAICLKGHKESNQSIGLNGVTESLDDSVNHD